MEKETTEWVAENNQVECYHDWQVIVSVNYTPWDEFMKFRGDLETIPCLTESLTHTLFCPKCKRIKKV